MHNLLERQLRRHLPPGTPIPPEWAALLEAVDATYREADEDRALIERSMEISSRELVERNAELRLAYDRLKDLDRFRTQFINNAAHELGTPLTPIKIQIHLLRRALANAGREDDARKVAVLQRNIERLADLSRDILDAARLQASKLTLQRTPVDTSKTVTEAVEAFVDAAREYGLTLSVAAEPGLEVVGDARRLSQVVYNLVSNAVKFTPRGGAIQVEAVAQGTDVVVRVRDTGLGLAPGDAERLFEPFVQVHETAISQHGTGLGLYISRGIVEASGGRMFCRSDGPGRGSTFGFVLPRAPSRPEAQVLPRPEMETVRR